VIWLPVVLTTIASGLYTCLWGTFKDAPYEGFRPRTFPRSILFSLALLAMLIAMPTVRPALERLTLFQLFFLIMGLERAWTEVYKGCFRPPRDTSRFLIPQQVTWFGRHVNAWWIRALVGLVLTASMVSSQLVQTPVRSFVWFLVTAVCTGVGVSMGGAYKDAPFEGFHPFKFFRSSLVLAAVSPVFYWIGPTPLGFLVMMNGGLERLLVEYYKSYMIRSVPGKFRPDLPIIEGPILRWRSTLNRVAAAIAMALTVLYILEWRG
jgi:hypothetical protein